MKKVFLLSVSAAALSMSYCAFAQSNVQLYGLIDMGYAVSNGGTLEGAKGREGKFQQWGNGTLVSRWGMKGREDLGNGNSIIYQLEGAINPEDGESNGFRRIAMVGAQGGFGTITAGRQQTIFDEVIGNLTPSGDPNLTSANVNTMVASGLRQNRYDSMLKYYSPIFAGFGLAGTYVSKNNDVSAANGVSKNLYSLAVMYNLNALSIGAAYESKPYEAQGMSSAWGIAATYDLKSFLLGAGYIDNHAKADGKGFYVGVSVPVDAFTIAAQVAYNTDARVGTEKIKPFGWELTGHYKLSDRTSLYATYGGIDSDAKKLADAQRKYSAAVGIVHRF